MRIEADLAEVDGGAAAFGHHLNFLFFLGLGVDSLHTSAHLEAAEVKEPAPEPNGGLDSEVTFAHRHKGGEQHDGIRSEVVRVQAVEGKKVVEELAHREPESAIEMRKEDDALAGLRCRQNFI